MATIGDLIGKLTGSLTGEEKASTEIFVGKGRTFAIHFEDGGSASGDFAVRVRYPGENTSTEHVVADDLSSGGALDFSNSDLPVAASKAAPAGAFYKVITKSGFSGTLDYYLFV